MNPIIPNLCDSIKTGDVHMFVSEDEKLLRVVDAIGVFLKAIWHYVTDDFLNYESVCDSSPVWGHLLFDPDTFCLHVGDSL